MGAVRGEVQRRPGEQPRQPRESRDGDGASGTVRGGSAAAVGSRRLARHRRGEAVESLCARRWTSSRSTRACQRCLPARRRDQRVHRLDASRGRWPSRDEIAELDAVLWTSAEALRVAAVLLSPVMPASCERSSTRLGAPVRRAAELRLDARRAHDGEWHAPARAGRCRSGRGSRPRPLQPTLTTKETRVTELPKDLSPLPSPFRRRRPCRAAAAAAHGTGTGRRQSYFDRRLHEDRPARGARS